MNIILEVVYIEYIRWINCIIFKENKELDFKI